MKKNSPHGLDLQGAWGSAQVYLQMGKQRSRASGGGGVDGDQSPEGPVWVGSGGSGTTPWLP